MGEREKILPPKMLLILMWIDGTSKFCPVSKVLEHMEVIEFSGNFFYLFMNKIHYFFLLFFLFCCSLSLSLQSIMKNILTKTHV